MLDPAKYGLSPTSPERYVAVAVEDLIYNVGKESLHIDGKITTEYLGMLSLYGIRRAYMLFPEGERFHGLVKLAYENFDHGNMSDALIAT